MNIGDARVSIGEQTLDLWAETRHNFQPWLVSSVHASP